MKTLSLPHNFNPRLYQIPPLQQLDGGKKRAVLLWHRRAGKDKLCINYTAMQSQRRVGSYFYLLPTYAQAKKIIWDGMDGDGFKFLDHFPKEMRASVNNTEMKLKLKNGSLFQCVGSDNIDSIMGTNPIGCVFSEYALQDPAGWDFVRPILKENGGWALFPYTPRGKNHGYRLYEMARGNDEWFTSRLTVSDTGVLSEEDIQAERDSGMDEELIQQEYYCSFNAGMQGSYYNRLIEDAEKDGRITAVPHDSRLPVDTWWDLGVGDSTAIWFVQRHYTQLRFIDYYETQGEGLPFYVHYLQRLPYNYGQHIAPHDIEVRELGTGKSRLETARSLGVKFRAAPKLPLDDGIQAVRMMLPNCWFDEKKCAQGIDALRSYRKEYDVKRQEFKNRPYHDWSSHAADAIRSGAVGRKDAIVPEKRDLYQFKYQKKRTYSWMAY